MVEDRGVTTGGDTAIQIESEDDFDMNEEIQKQIIQRRRRIFSHHRQYEQWRKKQFSYDSYSFRPIGGTAAVKRRMYKRQFSCMERSGGRSENNSSGSRDSRDSKYNLANSSVNSTKRNSVNSVSFLIDDLS